MEKDTISPILLKQRIRNRIIEVLELTSNFEEQISYQKNVPIAYVPAEVVCMWEDHVHVDNKEFYNAPVFSKDEQNAIWEYHEIWYKYADIVNENLELKELQKTKPWNILKVAAGNALEIFRVRGTMSEESTIF